MIEIVHAIRIEDIWSCSLELSQGDARWALPATAPGNLSEEDLQAYFDAQESDLWQVAERKQYPADVMLYLVERELLRRFLNILLDEINILRGVAGLPPRTLAQLKNALREK